MEEREKLPTFGITIMPDDECRIIFDAGEFVETYDYDLYKAKAIGYVNNRPVEVRWESSLNELEFRLLDDCDDEDEFDIVVKRLREETYTGNLKIIPDYRERLIRYFWSD